MKQLAFILLAVTGVASLAQAQVPLGAMLHGGRIHYGGGKFTLAKEQFQKALDAYGVTPDTMRAHMLIWLGLSEAHIGELDSAQAHLAGANAIAPAMTERLKTDERWTDLAASLGPDKAVRLTVFDAPGQSGAQPPVTSLVPFNQNGKWGYRDKASEVVIIAPRFDDARDFSEGLAASMQSGKWGYIDANGVFVIQPKYESADRYSEGLAAVGVLRKVKAFETSEPHEMALTGFIDKSGRMVINPQYGEAQPFSDGLALVDADPWTETQLCYVNRSGQVVIEPASLGDYIEAWSFSDGLARVQEGCWPDEYGPVGYIEKTGRLAIACRFDNGRDFSEGFAAVESGGKWGYIDKSGRVVIEPQYDEAGDFSSDGSALVVEDGIEKCIDRRGEEWEPEEPGFPAAESPE